MPGPPARSVDLTKVEVDLLLRITRRHTAPQHAVRRARMILLMHDGLGNTAIAGKLGAARSSVEDRRKRWVESRDARRACSEYDLPSVIEAHLWDAPRSGAPVTFSAEQVAQIMALSLQEPRTFGLPVSHWTPAELAREVVRQGLAETISPRTVGRFLKGGRPQAASEPLLAQPHAR